MAGDRTEREIVAVASMRPPRNAGEMEAGLEGGDCVFSSFNEAPAKRGGNGSGPRPREPQQGRFNEAPAKRGGNGRSWPVPTPTRASASMRPPRNAGEMFGSSRCRCRLGAGFNEAPAKRGGNVESRRLRGKGVLEASMRPPRNAGEMVELGRHVDKDGLASMRPPRNAGEMSWPRAMTWWA